MSDLSEVHDLLLRARTIQAERGHCKHVLEARWSDGYPTGSVCLNGALIIAAYGSVTLTWKINRPTIDAALALLSNLAPPMPSDPYADIPMCRHVAYNNAEATTLEDVLALLDRAIEATAPAETSAPPAELIYA